jgi:hypothetical protein
LAAAYKEAGTWDRAVWIWQNINPEAARSIWFGISAEDQQRFDE